MTRKKLCFRIPEPLRLALIDRSKTMGANRSQVILIALENYLNKQAKTPAA